LPIGAGTPTLGVSPDDPNEVRMPRRPAAGRCLTALATLHLVSTGARARVACRRFQELA